MSIEIRKTDVIPRTEQTAATDSNAKPKTSFVNLVDDDEVDDDEVITLVDDREINNLVDDDDDN